MLRAAVYGDNALRGVGADAVAAISSISVSASRLPLNASSRSLPGGQRARSVVIALHVGGRMRAALKTLAPDQLG